MHAGLQQQGMSFRTGPVLAATDTEQRRTCGPCELEICWTLMMMMTHTDSMGRSRQNEALQKSRHA